MASNVNNHLRTRIFWSDSRGHLYILSTLHSLKLYVSTPYHHPAPLFHLPFVLYVTYKFRCAKISHFLFFIAARICIQCSVWQDKRQLNLGHHWGPGLFQGPAGLRGTKAQGKGLLIFCHGLQESISFWIIPLGVASPDAFVLAYHPELFGRAGAGGAQKGQDPASRGQHLPFPLGSCFWPWVLSWSSTQTYAPRGLCHPISLLLVWGNFFSFASKGSLTSSSQSGTSVKLKGAVTEWEGIIYEQGHFYFVKFWINTGCTLQGKAVVGDFLQIYREVSKVLSSVESFFPPLLALPQSTRMETSLTVRCFLECSFLQVSMTY